MSDDYHRTVCSREAFVKLWRDGGSSKLRIDFNFKPYFNYLSSIFSALSGQPFLWFGFLEGRKMKIFRADVCLVNTSILRCGLVSMIGMSSIKVASVLLNVSAVC